MHGHYKINRLSYITSVLCAIIILNSCHKSSSGPKPQTPIGTWVFSGYPNNPNFVMSITGVDKNFMKVENLIPANSTVALLTDTLTLDYYQSTNYSTTPSICDTYSYYQSYNTGPGAWIWLYYYPVGDSLILSYNWLGQTGMYSYTQSSINLTGKRK